MTAYAVTFKDGRIGRRHDIEPQEFVAKGPGALPHVIFNWTRQHLASREVEIEVWGSDETSSSGTGTVTVGGFRVVGEFEWAEVPS